LTFGKAIRSLLALAAILIVVWSFFDVGKRTIASHFGAHRPITLTILHWGEPAENDILKKIVAHYEATHPNIHIENITASDYDPKLRTMFAAGTPPDVFYVPDNNVAEFASLNILTPLDPYLEEEHKAGTDAWMADFYPVIMNAFKYDGKHLGLGKTYGLPKDFTTCVMYVNVDLFKQAGLKVPYDGWTWEEFEADCRKITDLSKTSGREVWGGVLEAWPGAFRNIVWCFGGDFFTDDFRDTLLGTPGSQEALKLVRRLRFDEKTVYNSTTQAKEQGGEEFFAGNVGIQGPVGRWKTPRDRVIPAKNGPDDKDPSHFEWDVVPVPKGKVQASAIFTVAWSMSATTAHPKESYELIKFLCDPEGQALNSRLGLAIPALKSVANSDAFLGDLPKHSQVFLDAISYGRIGAVPKQPEAMRIIEKETTTYMQRGVGTAQECAENIQRDWHAELASPIKVKDYPPMRWGMISAITAAIILTAIFVMWMIARREKIGALDLRAERAGWLFISPWLIGFIALTAGPMIVSAMLAFTRWTALSPMSEAQFAGIDNFRHIATYDSTFFHSLWVTAYFVVVAVPLTQIAALAVALLMNSRVRGIAIFRTVYFVPSVVSGVALATLWLWIFNAQIGPMNKILAPVLKVFGTTPPDWIGQDAPRWAVPAFVIMGLWGVGGGMIIYLAGLKGISASLYEAATIDGAGPLRRFFNITLPMLSPLLFYQLIMGIIGSFQIFTQAKVMTPDGGAGNATLFYVFNLYRQAFEYHNMGYASAMAWILFLLLLALTVLIFRASRNLVYYEGLKS
jgi:ABC-type sugar transport system permease subunit/ABC-type glycerol-3-phosphate transport system substrate-binding protein